MIYTLIRVRLNTFWEIREFLDGLISYDGAGTIVVAYLCATSVTNGKIISYPEFS